MTAPALDPNRLQADGALGLLAQHLPKFELRPGQQAMVEAVATALQHKHDVLIEAGTGTGKTLAYLLPILASGERALLSTATRHLQTQIVGSDLPLALQSLGQQRSVAVLKGRANYLCLHRIDAAIAETRRQGRLPSADLLACESVARRSDTGDRAEVPGVDESSPVWPDVTSTADNCLGGQCPRFDQCFVARARRRAASADLVVVNHALLLADYAVRERWDSAGLLPQAGAIVIDEAHALADVATAFFGATLGERRLQGVARDVLALVRTIPQPTLADTVRARVEALQTHSTALFSRLQSLPPQTSLQGQTRADLAPLGHAIERALADLQDAAGHPELGGEPAWQKAGESLYALRGDLERVLLGDDDPSMVRWVEHRARDVAAVARPVDVGPILQRTLLAEPAVRVFTSATLTTAGRFDHVRQRLGLHADTASVLVPGAFDYPKQALLYVPDDVPDPFAPGRDQAVARHVEQLSLAAGGATLALFSSTRAMRDAAERLRRTLPWTVLVQGEAAREQLLDRFVRDQPAVLLATMGFWQGVDLPEDALHVVVLDKIPFPPPDDPLLAARAARCEEQGRSAFYDLMVPAAAIALRQGFGRLVRSRRHWGVVALLDPRMETKAYGRTLRESLPPAGRARNFSQVQAFLLDRVHE